MPAEPTQGLLDTNILALRRWIPAEHLPDEMAISAVTGTELAAGVHLVDGDDHAANQERARRVAVLQQTENEFDAIAFNTAAARTFGQMSAAPRQPGPCLHWPPTRSVAGYSAMPDAGLRAHQSSCGLPVETAKCKAYFTFCHSRTTLCRVHLSLKP